MDRNRLDKLISQKESITLEFKEAHSALPKNLFETVCAFLNRNGGDIFLGIDNSGFISGIEPDSIEKMAREISSLSNNPEYLNPPFIIFPESYKINNKLILHITVPESSQVHRFKGIVFDRSSEGDFQIKSPHQIARLSNKKSSFYAESKIYSYLTLNDFEKATIQRARNIIYSRKPDHPWLDISDEQMLHKAGLFRKDYITGEGGYTLASALLFGKEEVIQNLLPHHKVDALLRWENIDRYDDRLDVRVNLINSFYILMGFIEKYLPDPFYLEKEQRRSLRDTIFREVIVNLLVHQNYVGHAPARIIIYRDRVEMGNPSIPFKKGPLNVNDFIPYQKNPLISKFFLQLGWVEEIGSGLININKYFPLYAPAGSFELIEDEYFQVEFNFNRSLGPVKGPVKGPVNELDILSDLQLNILKQCQGTNKSRSEILKGLNLTVSGYFKKSLKKLIEKKYLEYTIPDKPGSRLQKYKLTGRGKEIIK
jgi:ATP-dependent DNA helicase RecG